MPRRAVPPRQIAVIDIGKTNIKVALVDLQNRAELAVKTMPNGVRPGPPYPHFDTESQWEFILAALADIHERHRVDAISVTTHGACAALLNAQGTLATPVLDYEHDGPDETAAAYDTLRPDFAETGSPRLPLGLNLGAQLHWLFARDPELRDRVATVVTWPQYWVHRLTGSAATDVTSLGCHTDLWDPHERKFSRLVARLGLSQKLAPALPSYEVVGVLRKDVAERTKMAPGTPVCCGIHDSNASLLPYLLGREASFSVVSTGTWVVVMTVGGDPVTLDPRRDTLINVNAYGEPIPSARFMGGREYARVQPPIGTQATHADVTSALARKLMLFPAVEPKSGPYQGRQMRWSAPEDTISAGERQVVVSWYLALMTAECLRITGARGAVRVEGPFARNAFYLSMLEAACGQGVTASASQTGTAQGAALLWAETGTPTDPLHSDTGAPRFVTATDQDPELVAYAAMWQARVARP
ncbi:FGGY-family carbohydrate kinase [Phaeovulum sp. W22_SRMD_FR3]|uniref:FGGY-family carbohydrate kinase n=1 Tax=Phaeovulum sp. W22_SRMD_FR3 TaxID=3240274 RepID=UPI003F9D7B0C